MRGSITVVADDLTGACEIAGVGQRFGLKAVVTLEDQLPGSDADLRVFDSETRLAQPASATTSLSAIGRSLGASATASIFKKTDSVLRGPLRAELEALASALGLRRVLLIPGNPALRRVVRDGRYFIDGKPLHQTGFATDPHHPARSSDVRDLLGHGGNMPVSTARLGQPLPAEGIVVGDVSSDVDLQAWAAAVPPDTLASGSSAFFGAWFAARNTAEATRAPDRLPEGPTLLVSGTTFGPQRKRLCRDVSVDRISLDRLSEIDDWSQRLLKRLERGSRAVACVDGPVSPESRAAANIGAALAEVTCRVFQAGAVRHVVVEGGATAAAIARRLGWLTFEGVHEWALGIVSLRPVAAREAFFTVKPGSYPWPDSILPLLFPSCRTASP